MVVAIEAVGLRADYEGIELATNGAIVRSPIV